MHLQAVSIADACMNRKRTNSLHRYAWKENGHRLCSAACRAGYVIGAIDLLLY